MIFDPQGGERVVWEWRKIGSDWGSRKEAVEKVPDTWRGPHHTPGPGPAHSLLPVEQDWQC